ncbi:bifunctional folylpolyglutamate synthase/dihydrofolate synthase [Chryseobacterium sp. A301]
MDTNFSSSDPTEFKQEEYDELLQWLFSQIPNYQKQGKSAYKPGLESIKTLTQLFGNPEKKLKCIHVGGTNGKGSTSSMIASVLQEAGYKVGLYTSPHLIDFTERIKLNGENVDKGFVFQFLRKIQTLPLDFQPSFFEYTTLLAYCYFAHSKVDYALIEVGLGGRLDSTNTITPLVSAITNIALDHTDLLGETLEEIAGEKAGIIKPGVPIVSGELNPAIALVLQNRAIELNSPFIDATELKTVPSTDLKGNYQKKNSKVALSVLHELRKMGAQISDDQIRQGLLKVQENTQFLGRWYEFSHDPLVLCDTGHNHAGLIEVFAQLESLAVYKHIVLGFVKDKKIEQVMEILPLNTQYYFVKPAIERGRNPQEYETLLKKAKINYKIFNSVQEGYLAAKQNVKNSDIVFIGGSNFVVGEFLEINLEK